MTRPQVADGGDSLQIWRVAANILNKQSLTADKGWSSSLEVGRTTPQCKKISLLRNVTKSLKLEKMTYATENVHAIWYVECQKPE
jgi:hypothetical protein